MYDCSGAATGQPLTVRLHSGRNELTLPTAGFAGGVYLVRISGGSQTAAAKLVVP